MFKTWFVAPLIVLLFAGNISAQTCPENIDFKDGTFNHWACQTGGIDRSGIITFTAQGAVNGRQTIIANTDPGVDAYGKFSIVGPNGTPFSIKLGNEQAGAQAEQASYTYTIPADKIDYVFTYYYAVVLQLTNHLDFERPRFSVKLTDITNNNEIVACGTHDFVSGDGLGDFQKSTVGQVEYRDWSTVAVNLAGRQGHTIRFDFTTNDCVYSAHFGYAYISFDDPCIVNKDPITGSNYCRGVNTVTLNAPPGFGSYIWHQENSTQIEGSGQHLTLTPVPADGTKYVVDAVSTSGVGAGCPASFKTTIHKIDEDYVFNLQTATQACEEVGVDLTNPALTANSSPSMTYKYYEDVNGSVSIRNPKMVVKSGTYYIRGTNGSGCTDVKPIDVLIFGTPNVTITPPKPVCAPATIDLTDPAIIGGIDPNATYAYFRDPTTNIPENNPKQISLAGIYYIRVTNVQGCSNIFPVNTTILQQPVINSRTISGCAPLDITKGIYHDGDTYDLIYSYFADASLKIPLNRPDLISQNGIYYAIGTNSIGCVTAIPAAITVQLYPPATLAITNPDAVKYPKSIDLTTSFTAQPGYTYTYFSDSLGKKQIDNYKSITETGKYYIKATTANGCEIIQPVKTTVNEPDPSVLLVNNTFTPNGDGVNDEFTPELQGVATVNYLKIYSRNGNQVFETKDLALHWKGNLGNLPLPQGTYYWVFSGYDIYRKKTVTQSGSVTIVR